MTPTQNHYLPHQRLAAYHVAVELLTCVHGAYLRDARLRDQARRAAQGACLNIGEAAGRTGRADRARVFAIARGEASEVAVAAEIALVCGSIDAASAARIGELASRLFALLGGLIRA